MSNKYFTERPELRPTIYVYEIPDAENRKGLLKVGYTTRSAKNRIKEQLQTSGVEYKILLEEDAIRNDGSTFDDHEIHRFLIRKKFENTDGEWFKCKVKDVKSAILAIKNREKILKIGL